MAEWAVLRPAQTTAAKFYDRDLNLIHKGYLASKLDPCDPAYRPADVSLERYADGILEYLTRTNDPTDVDAFVSTHAALIEAGTFCPKVGKFSRFLNAEWDAWCDRHGVARPMVEEDIPAIAVQAAVAVKRPTPDNLVAAREKFIAKEAGAEDELFRLLTVYALGFSRAAMRGCPDYLNLSDDIANIAVVYIWRNMASYKGTGHQFVKWCRTICQRAGVNGLHSNLDLEDDRQPLEIPDRENPGLSMDNPALYRDEQPQYMRVLPEFINGTDRLICSYIRQDLDYEQIAKTMGLTESGVRNRIASIRTKVRKLKTVG